MRRTLITGALCLAAGYAVAAALPDLSKDIGRYNKIRAMSDQGTLLSGLVQSLPALGVMAFEAFNAKKQDGRGAPNLSSIFSFIPDISKDIARYQKIRSM